MGFYKVRSLAVYCLSGLLMVSLICCYVSFHLLHQKKIQIRRVKSFVKSQPPSIDEWMQIAQEFHLHMIRFRPVAKDRVQIGLQGQYQDFISCLRLQIQKHPHWRWSRILIEEKNHLLWMHWELSV